MKEHYVRYVIAEHILDGNFDSAFGGRWVDEGELAIIKSTISANAFRPYGIIAEKKYADVVESIFRHLLEESCIVRHGDDYTGNWYQLNKSRKNEKINALLAGNPVMGTIKALPEEAFSRALTKVASEDGLGQLLNNANEDAAPPAGKLKNRSEEIAVPAADRIVSLKHNQVSEFDEQISELIQKLDDDNGDPDSPGLRERLLGQIKAGRELIRAGEFRAYLLYEVLVRALGELLDRYGNPSIKALANALLGAVVSKIIEGN